MSCMRPKTDMCTQPGYDRNAAIPVLWILLMSSDRLIVVDVLTLRGAVPMLFESINLVRFSRNTVSAPAAG